MVHWLSSCVFMNSCLSSDFQPFKFTPNDISQTYYCQVKEFATFLVLNFAFSIMTRISQFIFLQSQTYERTVRCDRDRD
ncbi:hypothetical protein M153_59300030 [Pseudoloma neurophilia]|uniref:Uncharacterized protein n=1 Tax=Pseudoloma neurophilia TaxID=146866 RepID=A0A0R0LWM2_9MICR|nr:hypothetical protein M153_59300030 [Pseudoloma neurophilia]